MTTTAHGRTAWRFDGELDDVTAGAAASLARMAHALLQHGDLHDGGRATIRMARLGSSLNLWLTDPACSPACLCGSGHLPSAADQRDAPPGEVRLVLGPDLDGGLRLHWALELDEEPAPPRRSDANAHRHDRTRTPSTHHHSGGRSRR